MRAVFKKVIIEDLRKKSSSYYRNNYETQSVHNYLRRLRLDLIKKRIEQEQKGKFILDVGCGPAILYQDLLSRCERYFALDISQSSLKEIKLKNFSSKLRYICADLDDFIWESDYFDIIICLGVLEYTQKPADNLIKLVMYLKKNGILLCSFPNMLSPYRIWSEFAFKYFYLIKKMIRKEKEKIYPRKLFNESKLRKKIAKIEPSHVETKYFGFKLFPQPFDFFLSNIDHKLISFFHEHPVKIWEKFCSEFLLIVRK